PGQRPGGYDDCGRARTGTSTRADLARPSEAGVAYVTDIDRRLGYVVLRTANPTGAQSFVDGRSIARTRIGVMGSRVTPPGRPMASSMAAAIAAPMALEPASPAPLTPSGLSRLGASSVTSMSMTRGISAMVGIR